MAKTNNEDIYIVAAVRTPVGKAPRGIFRNTRPDDLLAHVIQHAVKKVPSIDPNRIDDVIVGCAMPEAEQGMNVARIALLLGGLPDSVAGMTVNRFCASGLQTIALAANRIRAGEADVIIAGGTESMSLVPMGGFKYSVNPNVFRDDNLAIAYGMGITAEKVATKWKIERDAQEEFALESHRRAVSAIQKGEFKDEIIPYIVSHHEPDLKTGGVVINNLEVKQDEGPRKETSKQRMQTLPTAFAAKGTITAATSSQMSDGAAALILVNEKALKEFKLKPLALFRGFSVAGVPPEYMGIGPVQAVPKVLEQTGLKQNDISWIELNEAFAAQTLAVMHDLELDHQIVNPLGGAIALGHPLGATGAIRATTLIHGLHRHKKKYGMVTMCVGTGMGAAGIFEAV